MLTARQHLDNCGLSVVTCTVHMHSRAVDPKASEHMRAMQPAQIIAGAGRQGMHLLVSEVLAAAGNAPHLQTHWQQQLAACPDSISCLCRAASAWGCFSSIHAEMVQSSSSQGETRLMHISSCTGQMQCRVQLHLQLWPQWPAANPTALFGLEVWPVKVYVSSIPQGP